VRHSTRTVASLAGIAAALLGLEHGYFELIQGNTTPSSILINAIGLPCQPKAAWHACEPAITLLPTFSLSGILAISVSLVILVWAAAFVGRKHGGTVLIFLCVLQLLVGGGFVSPMIGIVAGVAGTRINMPIAAPHSGQFLAKLWPGVFICYLLWLPSEWLLGAHFNDVMVNLGGVLLLFSLGLLLLTVLAAAAHDQQTGSF